MSCTWRITSRYGSAVSPSLCPRLLRDRARLRAALHANSRIHLVAPAIAELRRGLRRFAKRSVKPGTIFRGVRKDGNILKSVRIQFWRIAATRPSIMSDGAMMSAPARACERASSASNAIVESFSTSPFLITPQCPWLVYSHKQTSVSTSKFNFALRIPSIARCTTPSAASASLPSRLYFRASQKELPREFRAAQFRGTLPQFDPRIVARLPASS